MTAPEYRALTAHPADSPEITTAMAAVAIELASSAQALHRIACYLAAQTAVPAPWTATPESVRPFRAVLSKLFGHGPELLVGIAVTIIAVMVSFYLFGESF